MDSTKREDLPTDADNYDVYCERCQRVHKYYPMTREQFDKIISTNAKALADAIDAQIADEIYKKFK